MEANLYDIVNKLNRLSKLFTLALHQSKPYRIGRQRIMLTEYLYEIKKVHPIEILDSNNYESVLGKQPILQNLQQDKQKSLHNKLYELAVHLRDQEKERIRELLMFSHNIDASASFFVHENKIYKLF